MSDLQDYKCNCVIAKKKKKRSHKKSHKSDTDFSDSYQHLTCQLLKDFTVIVCNKCKYVDKFLSGQELVLQMVGNTEEKQLDTSIFF